MATSAQQIRAWKGPAVLSYGYRPFFILGALLAVFALGAWIMMFSGYAVLPIAIDPISWHAHSFLFGYLWAIIAGFLMTAVPNWTGRFPIIGWPLLGLVSLWLVGRIAISCSALIPIGLAITLDLAFPLTFVVVIAREIIAGKNWRNLKVLALIGLLFIANIVFDYEAFYGGNGFDGYGSRLAVGVAITLIAVIGGRIIPSFTRNWLVKHPHNKLPVPYNRFDFATMALTALALIIWVIAPDTKLTAIMCLLAGLLNLARLIRWRGWLTLREPLVWVLHLSYLFIPLGFFSLALTNFALIPGGIATMQHLWMAGAIGMMTVAVMTRASLGHSGRPLHASLPVALIYVALFLSIVARIISGMLENRMDLLHLSAGLWFVAFSGFLILYWNILTKPRLPRT